jgi:hypothetical protein
VRIFNKFPKEVPSRKNHYKPLIIRKLFFKAEKISLLFSVAGQSAVDDCTFAVVLAGIRL